MSSIKSYTVILYVYYILFVLQVSSELNAAILRYHNQPTITPKLYNLMKLIMWAQDELDRKKVKFPRMTDFGSATLEPPK